MQVDRRVRCSLQNSLQSADMVIVAVAEYDGIDFAQIDPQDMSVVEQYVTLAGIKEDSARAKLDPE